MALQTARLTLHPCSPVHLLALIEEPEHFEELVDLALAPGIREMFTGTEVSPAWIETLRASAEPDPWRFGFFVVHRGSGSIIGAAGFKGPRNAEGTVEIAYGIAPAFRDQGYATEAAAALTDFAFTTPGVERVRAHTLPETNASTRVLAKCGFRHVGAVVDPEDGPVWRWERTA